jgi:hypothetical protein
VTTIRLKPRGSVKNSDWGGDPAFRTSADRKV